MFAVDGMRSKSFRIVFTYITRVHDIRLFVESIASDLLDCLNTAASDACFRAAFYHQRDNNNSVDLELHFPRILELNDIVTCFNELTKRFEKDNLPISIEYIKTVMPPDMRFWNHDILMVARGENDITITGRDYKCTHMQCK